MSINFKEWITRLIEENGWKAVQLDEDGAYLEFEAESGQTQLVEIFHDAQTGAVLITAPMSSGYASEADILHPFSSALLRRNDQIEFGYWSLQDIDGELTYTCMAEALVDELDRETFAQIVSALAAECDEAEAMLEAMEDQPGG